MPSADELRAGYYVDLASAYVRGAIGEPPGGAASPEELLRFAGERGLRIHRFKRTSELPRVRRIIGVLRGLQPSALLDVGSGRGAFLWPLLDAFPELRVTAIDRDPKRVAQLEAVSRGGVARLTALQMDATALELGDQSFEVVTLLEVLEHLEAPERALLEAVRVAQRFVVLSVPSHPDDNPEHIQLFDRARIEAMLDRAGAVRVNVEYVHNHLIAVAEVDAR